MFKFRKKREKGHEYNLTYDNLAVPEIHTHEPEDAAAFFRSLDIAGLTKD